MIIEHKGKRIVVFSDTHGSHRKLPIVEADIAIHLGDACSFGNNIQMADFLDWFSLYPAKHRLFIAGNHEIQWIQEPHEFLDMFPQEVVFVENKAVYLEGLCFLSVPARIELYVMPKIKNLKEVDILLTHAPPRGILDNGLGCSILKRYVTRLKPSYHLFGHIHETSGQRVTIEETTYINTAYLES